MNLQFMLFEKSAIYPSNAKGCNASISVDTIMLIFSKPVVALTIELRCH